MKLKIKALPKIRNVYSASLWCIILSSEWWWTNNNNNAKMNYMNFSNEASRPDGTRPRP